MEFMKFLFKQTVSRAVLGRQDAKGNTALHVAAISGKIEAINALVKLGASLEDRNKRGETPLFLAVLSGREEAAIGLLEHGADPLAADDEGTTVLHVAASLGLNRLLEHLGREKKRPESQSRKDATKPTSGSTEESEVRCADGKEITKNRVVQKESTLAVDSFESIKGNIRISKDSGKCANVRSWEDIYTISESLQVSSDSEDEEFETHCNVRGITKLQRSYIEDISKSSFDLNVVNEDGNTLLHLAALFGAKRALRRFLKTKPDVNIRGKSGCTPLILAAKCGCVAIVRDLLSAGADINASTVYGHTALHLAVWFNNISAVRTLIQSGAELDNKDFNGNTPLHQAVLQNSTQSVLALIKGGVNIQVENNEGITPIQLAALTNNLHLLDILIRLS